MSSEMWHEISQAIDHRSAGMADLVMRLVRIRSESPPGDSYVTLVELLRDQVESMGFSAERVDIPESVVDERCRRYHPQLTGPRANLVARRAVTGVPGMIFYTHIDTVPAGDMALWSHDPFAPHEADGYIYGRGTADSKGGIAALLAAFGALHELDIQLAVSPLVAFTSDEEIGPYTGLMYLADSGVFDGYQRFHSVDGMAENIAVGRLGNFTWNIEVIGRGAHSGRSVLGLNPIERSRFLLDELARMSQEVDARRGALTTSPEFAEATGRTHLSPSLNVTVAQGGVKENIIPARFVLKGDRRYLPEEDVDECIEELRTVVGRARKREPDLRYELMIVPGYPSHASDPSDPWVQRVQRVISGVRGRDVPLGAASGSSDTAHVGRVTDLVLTHHGVGWIDSNVHSDNERVAVKDLLDIAKVVAALAAGIEPEHIAGDVS
jgi:succinyl-diaminopimelate desuccinylase